MRRGTDILFGGYFRAIPLRLMICTIAICMASIARAQQSGDSPSAPQISQSTNTLDMTLDTGASTSVEQPVRNSASAPGARTSGVDLASRGSLTSRATFREAPSAAPHVLAQIGLVSAGSLNLRIARDPKSPLLSTVSRGVYLAVVADGGDWWGVLMVNNTMGWAPKSALQLIPYQQEISVPSDPLKAAQQTQTADDGAAGTVGGSVAEGLDGRTSAILREAMSYLGVPYVWAGNTRAGLDCSGFVKAVFGSQGISLPRYSGDQARVGQNVAGTDLRPGDRLYFDMGHRGAVSHCGIYLGNGYFIHSSTNHGHVDIDSIYKPHYLNVLVSIRRS